MSWVLWRYISARYMRAFFHVFAGAHLIIFIVGLIEILRREGVKETRFLERVELAALAAPGVALVALPVCVLLAALWCGANLARTSEIVVMRGIGVSAWRITRPIIACSALLGCLAMTLYNPLATALADRKSGMEARFFARKADLLSLSAEGLWLRQNDGRKGASIIRAVRAKPDASALYGVTFLRFLENGRPWARIEADSAQLHSGYWELRKVLVHAANLRDPSGVWSRSEIPSMQLRTDLTSARILGSFAEPDAISFWNLPGFIDALERSGFSATRHRLAWQTTLALPLFLAGMGMVGAAFSLRHVRFGGLGNRAFFCALTGFTIFFLTDVSRSLGMAQTVPVFLAAWSAPIATALLAGALLMHVEEV